MSYSLNIENASEIRFMSSSDRQYAENLTKDNMSPYYKVRDIQWNSQIFEESWRLLDNYDIYIEQHKVGVIRFSYDADKMLIRDFQIEPRFQRQGIGGRCLDKVKEIAIKKKYSSIGLRVFGENHAINLYKRAGFDIVLESGELIEMRLLIY